MNTVTVFLCIIGAMLCLPSYAQTANAERWPVDKAWRWYNRQPWICGFNYVPSTACNTTEFWSAETFDVPTIARELGWAHDVGFNSCRVFIQYLVWKNNPDGLKQRLDRFLAIAAENGISVVPTLFDDCTFGDPPLTEPFLGKQREPIPGMILPSWTPSPGLSVVSDRVKWPELERYVIDLATTFAKDRRILFWDLYNEPGNSNMGDKSLPLAEAAFGWARTAKPEQPLTIAVWSPAETMNDVLYSHSDIVTYHAYTNLDGMKSAIATHRKVGRPVICSEWMSRHMGSRWDTDLGLFKEEWIACYCWGLVNGRTQAQYSWTSKKGDSEPSVWFHDLFHRDGTPYDSKEVEVIRRITGVKGHDSETAPAPLFADPVYDGAADPTLVWNRNEKTWWVFYTARRANATSEPGVRWCHATDIGIAVSPDGGHTWNFHGTARGLEFEPGQNAWWAPEVFWHEDRYHMFVSYVPGMHEDWSGNRYILHYTSDDLLDWRFESRLALSSEYIIDPCVYRFTDGTWRMWYKDEADHSHIYMAESTDLYQWKVMGPAEASRGQEAPNVFRLGGFYWMLTDSGGLNVYRSNDALKWEYQGPFMRKPGNRRDDDYAAQHPDVVILEDAAYIIYFVHPYGKKHIELDKHRSVLQVARLEVRDGKLAAIRNEPFRFRLMAPSDGLYHGEQ